MEDRHWIKTAKGYEGLYQTKFGIWKGKIERDGNSWEYYIFNPPQSILQGKHEACFHHKGGNWWWIHFKVEPLNPSDGVLAVERLIIETFSIPNNHLKKKQSWLSNLFGGD